MTRPRFSILMPAYNSSTYAREAVGSALREMGDADELIVQDGGSTDGTLQVFEEFALMDARVKVQSAPDQGQSDALNKALSRAAGDYVVWLNADDVILPGGLCALRKATSMAGGSPEIVFGGHRTLRADGSTIAQYEPAALNQRKILLDGCYVFSGSLAIATDFLRRVGGFSTELHYCMDFELMLRMLSHITSEPVNCHRQVGALRWHKESKSGSAGLKFIGEGWRIRNCYINTRRDRIVCLVNTALALAAVWSTPLRHSRFYTLVRGSVRK